MTVVLARAPGRVNIIGEHTDYSGGFVFPCAIAAATTVRFEPESQAGLRIETHLGRAWFDLTAIPREPFGDWRDYPRGVLRELQIRGCNLRGGEMRVESTVPIGAGLSSSASFEIALALACIGDADAAGRLELAKLAQRAENAYTGTKSGIMDQFAVLFGRKGHALLLDTRALTWEEIPIPPHLNIVVANSMESRELNEGGYNARRSQSEDAAGALRAHAPHVRELRDVTVDDLPLAQRVLRDRLYRRTKHVVTENARALETASAFRNDDPVTAGNLMNASHESLRTDYEVSTVRLDALVEAAREAGAYGSRMMGGGFGGCTVSLVERAQAQTFAAALVHRFHERTGVRPEIYDGTPSDGASVRRDD